MKRITQYRVALFNRSVNYGLPNGLQVWTTAQIRVAFEDGGGGWLIFYDAELTEATPGHRFGNSPLFFYPKEQYALHLDLLRNEEPIFIQEDSAFWTVSSLRTASEDVGDGE